ncbi:hypothetical protein [Labrys monachus]|uniref:Uncharacterized protein n=1 Tax=Labrys monachus TaxID=217067 RepID=A0ABU0FLG2_9HYPH|nr:hypothetical protein [Labrys monachus]MDQ0395443.1 hypothetical protein [Labrys monachus]
MKYILPLSVLLLTGMNCASASDLQLTAAEIKARIIGNTVLGVEDGNPYQEYFNPNGSISGKSSTETYTGAWRIQGDKLCMGYESDDESGQINDWNCSDVGVIGDRVIWNDDGELSEGKLVAGGK